MRYPTFNILVFRDDVARWPGCDLMREEWQAEYGKFRARAESANMAVLLVESMVKDDYLTKLREAGRT